MKTGRWSHHMALLVALLTAASGCVASVPGAGGPRTGTASHASATPGPQPSETASVPKSLTAIGHVIGLDGKPAAGVAVEARLYASGAAVISNNGGGAVSGGGTLISDSGGSLRYAVAAEGEGVLKGVTDAAGGFSLPLVAGEAYNIEALQMADVKAIDLGVTAGGAPIELQLAYTGTVSGQVRSENAEVTDLEGTVVFIPGTSYLAITDHDGHFTLANVPVGSFELVARKDELGRASAKPVVVTSKQETVVPGLVLSQSNPILASITPPAAGPGATVELVGSHFGTTENKALVVQFAGAVATKVERLGDDRLKVEVPAGAGVGDVAVTVGGVLSNGVRFRAVKTIVLSAPKSFVAQGEGLPIGAVVRDTENQPVTGVTLGWEADGPGVTVDATGVATGVSAGPATIYASTGTVKGHFPLEVTARALTLGTFTMPAGVRPDGVAVGPDGSVWVLEPDVSKLGRFQADGTPVATYAGPATFGDITSLAVDAAGTAFVVVNHVLYKLGADGHFTAVAGTPGTDGGNDGVGTAAQLRTVRAIVPGTAGVLYLLEEATIRRVDPDGRVTTIAGSGQLGQKDAVGLAATFEKLLGGAIIDDTLYVAERYTRKLRSLDLKTLAVSTLEAPDGGQYLDSATGIVAVDHQIYIAEAKLNRLDRLDPATMDFKVIAGTGAPENKDGPALDAAIFMDGDPAPMAVDAASRTIYVSANHTVIRTLKF